MSCSRTQSRAEPSSPHVPPAETGAGSGQRAPRSVSKPSLRSCGAGSSGKLRCFKHARAEEQDAEQQLKPKTTLPGQGERPRARLLSASTCCRRKFGLFLLFLRRSHAAAEQSGAHRLTESASCRLTSQVQLRRECLHIHELTQPTHFLITVPIIRAAGWLLC